MAAPAQPAPAAPQPPPTAPATRAARPDETPIDPLSITFDVSVDHDAEDAAGPRLLKYVIDFVPVAGAPGKAHTVDLGKPKPVNGSISVTLWKGLVPGTYNAHVSAIGRGLRTSTATVGPFVITEKTGKTKRDRDKELTAPDKPQDQRKPKEPPTAGVEPAAAPPPAPPDTSKDDSEARPQGRVLEEVLPEGRRRRSRKVKSPALAPS